MTTLLLPTHLRRIVSLPIIILSVFLISPWVSQAQVPPAPTLSQPANESVGVSVTPVFKWSKIAQATSYRLRLSTSSAFPVNDIQTRDIKNITDTTYTIGSNIPITNYDRVYYWQVFAVNASGESQPSPIWTFTTVEAADAPVILISPENNTQNAPVYPTLNWHPIPGSSQYTVAIASNPQFTGAVNQSTNATSLIPINQLQPFTQYHWRVRTRINDADGPWSQTRTFTTYGPPSSGVQLASPGNLSANNSRLPTLRWFPLDDAEFYQVQVSTISNFNDIILQRVAYPDTSVTFVDELDPLTQYYWRVRGGNDLGLTDSPETGYGPWSNVRSFITENVKVELLSPGDNAENVVQPLEFSWLELEGASAYTFELSKSPQFVPFTERSLIDPQSDTVRYQVLAVLESRTTYYWRVKADLVGGESDFSLVRTFKTKATGDEPPLAIKLHSPADDSTDTPLRPTFRWLTDTTSVQGYRIQLATSSNFAINTIERNVLVDDTLHTLSADLLPGITHFWRVRGISAGGEGDWSETWTFITQAFPVVLQAPSDNAINVAVRPMFSWIDFPEAVGYRLEVHTEPDFEDPDYVLTDIPANNARLDEVFEYSTAYFWRVKATTLNGFSSWSSVRSFTTISDVIVPPGIVSLISPEDEEVDVLRTPEFSWHLEENSQSYSIQVSRGPNFVLSELEFTVASTNDTTLVSLTELDENTQYYWRVKGINVFGDGPWSQVRFFTTRSELPGSISLLAPAQNASGVSVSPLFTWQASVNSDLYHLQISTASNFSTLVYELNNLTGVSHAINAGLNLGTLYFWRVRGINAFGDGAWSETRSFTTLTLAPATVELHLPANDSTGTPRRPRLVWVATTDAISYEVQLSTASNHSSIDYEYLGIENTILEMPEDLAYNTPYFWRVRAVNAGGVGPWSETWKFTVQRVPVNLEDDQVLPVEYILKQNFPNPFNPETRIEFGLPETGPVSLHVYDVMGRLVSTLIDNDVRSSGYHVMSFNGLSKPSGVYMVRLQTVDGIRTMKMTLLK